ncbi:hypothetical protein lbkm_2990 [Lachnospiraceae bacterium KM106-2]|nr:hypothetical protein lbkm_2990 [Lachnospiraceae bacterium KM106-2]
MAKKSGHKTKKIAIKKVVKMELLYMTPSEIGVKEMKELLETKEKVEINTWPAIEIMELTMPSGKTADFETMTDYIDHPEDLAYMQSKNVKTVYAITVEEEDFEELKPYVKALIEKYEGFLCSDSEDFQPEYQL